MLRANWRSRLEWEESPGYAYAPAPHLQSRGNRVTIFHPFCHDESAADDELETVRIAVSHVPVTRVFQYARRPSKKDACREFDIIQQDKVVKMNPDYMRTVDFTNLRGDATKAKQALGSTPRVKFNELVRIMVESNLRSAEVELGYGE